MCISINPIVLHKAYTRAVETGTVDDQHNREYRAKASVNIGVIFYNRGESLFLFLFADRFASNSSNSSVIYNVHPMKES